LLEAGRIRLDGKEIGAFAFKTIAPEYPYAIWMPQPIFLAALLRRASPLPSFRCWMGAKVTALVEEDGRVVGVRGTRRIQVGLILPTGEWRRWRQEGLAAVAARIRRFDPVVAGFADGLTDFTPFFPLEGVVRLVADWARDGLLLIGDAAHTMSPAGAIGVNVAIATAAVAAQVIYPSLGRGPIPRATLHEVQRLREADVRTLHRLQLGAQRVLIGQPGTNPLMKWLAPPLLSLALHSPLLPRVQRRIFFGAPLPPLDPAFSFREGQARLPSSSAQRA
jgi:2-polyprenyl-6-methoxyphenol hydroxylase-like FAD-dependent oxidoreductase